MKNVICTLSLTVLFSVSTFAVNPVKKEVKSPIQAIKVEKVEAKKVTPPSDWAGFVCWLFGGHCA